MTDVVSSTRESLKRLVPNAKNIIVKVQRDHDRFRSKIHVKVPGRVLHSVKEGETAMRAIDESYHAVLKQFEKMKNKRLARKKDPKRALRVPFSFPP